MKRPSFWTGRAEANVAELQEAIFADDAGPAAMPVEWVRPLPDRMRTAASGLLAWAPWVVVPAFVAAVISIPPLRWVTP